MKESKTNRWLRSITLTVLLTITVLVMASCGGEAEDITPATPTNIPSITPTIVPTTIATPTPTPSPTPSESPSVAPTSTPVVPTITPVPPSTQVQFAVIGGYLFHLEVPVDDAAFMKGLGGRSYLPADSAMLFIFQQEARLVFWMKDTQIALDILFLDSNQKIVDIQTMQPEPGVPDQNLRRYQSAAPAIYAIEMNAGLAKQLGFTIGWKVEFFTQSPTPKPAG